MNGNTILILYFAFTAVVAGLTGTLIMTFFMQTLTARGIANADMVRAIGSFFTKSENHSYEVGSALHAVGGVIFGAIYVLIFSLLGINGPAWALIGIGALAGTIHGFVMSFFLVVSVAEHHPVARFREVGFDVAIVHLLGHIVYGAIVGAIVYAMGFALI